MIVLQTALKYFRQAHLEYLWLHFLVAIVLIVTSVFWFILPYYIISYGLFETFLQQFTFVLALFLVPSFFITLHCWFINMKAALKWKENHPNENVMRWVLKFQSITIAIVIIFTAIIMSTLFFIDMVR